MRLLVYEWCSSGGLAGPSRPAVLPEGHDAEPLAREGLAMFRAVIADAVRDGGWTVAALLDASHVVDLPVGVEPQVVPAGQELDGLVTEAARADAVIVVAPETAGVLIDRVDLVRRSGAKVVSPGRRFLEITSDKHTTIETLAEAGVPVPRGMVLDADESWPEGFPLPAVRKARSSCGCDGLVVVRPGDALPCPAGEPTRLERFHTGLSVGVSCLLGPTGITPVTAIVQRFSAEPSIGFRGGDRLADPGLRRRAEAHAVAAVAAVVSRCCGDAGGGWVGVDMILGAAEDGREDVVLEINPRLTTSFVGLAAVARSSVVRAMLDADAGRPVPRDLDHDFTSFTVTG